MKIQTRSGRLVDPFKLKSDDVVLEDIAHALSNICRFTGHCARHYSVAQHTVHGDAWGFAGASKSDRMWWFVHDAAEAYLGDVAGPIKRKWPVYAEAEGRAMGVIASALGVGGQIPSQAIATVDLRMLATERAQLMRACKPEDNVWWNGADIHAEFPYTCVIEDWHPKYAEFRFLRLWKELCS